MLNFLNRIPTFIKDLICIIIIAAAAGFSVYYFSDNGFSFKEKPKPEKTQNEVSLISINKAKSAFENTSATFVDSRNKKYFDKSHIFNAVNLPADNHLEYSFNFLSAYPDKTKKMIVYCDGKNCDSSYITAKFLKELGYQDVNILTNGWSLWKEHNLPVFPTENSNLPEK
jgi:rhodanese-related sulfurtransferase